MAEIHPFRGVHYNLSLLKDPSAVICPPYDIITPQMEQELLLKSEYNFIRLESGRELPKDTTESNKYTRSAATLEQWLRQGILEIDKEPAIYLHDHYFTYREREYKRREIITRVRLEEWDKMIIRPHEGILTEPKNDRLNLLWALQANTSPILTLFEDLGQQVSSLLAVHEANQPLINQRRHNGEGHDVWSITEPEVIQQIGSSLAHQPLYIADGHHRYESALTHQHERLACSPSASADEAFNFVMMTLVDFSDPGLLILPPHRLVRGVSKSTLKELMAKLKTFFEVEELPLSMPDVWQKVDDILTGPQPEETNQVRMVLFGLSTESMFVLRLCNPTPTSNTSQMMPYFHSELYKSLDVSIVEHIILEKLLGLHSEGEVSLGYGYERQDTIDRVLNGEYQLALLLSPVKTRVIKAIADAGDRLPRKSTYFYPKPPAGLIFNRLV